MQGLWLGLFTRVARTFATTLRLRFVDRFHARIVPVICRECKDAATEDLSHSLFRATAEEPAQWPSSLMPECCGIAKPQPRRVVDTKHSLYDSFKRHCGEYKPVSVH